MSWNSTAFNGDQEINRLGMVLSQHVQCCFRLAPYSGHGKPVFECRHLRVFPVFAIKGAIQSGDWSDIQGNHQNLD